MESCSRSPHKEVLKNCRVCCVKLGLRLVVEDKDEMDGVVALFEFVGALFQPVYEMRDCEGRLGQFYLRVETNEFLVLDCFDLAPELSSQCLSVLHQ